MDANWIAAVSVFALAMAATPGPNNTLATASGANHGFRRTLPFIAGVTIGVTAIIVIVGAAGASLFHDPRIQGVLKWLGLAYLLWLAWKIATARPGMPGAASEDTSSAPLTLVQGMLFQFINPKLWVMVAGAVVTYGGTARDTSPVAIAMAFGIVFGTVTFASVALWVLIGVGAARVLQTPRRMRAFNVAMAGLLVASLIPVISG